MYNRTEWKDRVVDSQTGEVIQQGTNQSAGNFNKMEDGITDASIAAALLSIAAGQTSANQSGNERQFEAVDQRFDGVDLVNSDANTAAKLVLIAVGQLTAQTADEEKIVQLTNTQSYPFNNSQQTVSLRGTKTTTAYSVDVEVLEHDGDVGDVIVYDKLLNGFKVRYDGSAKSAKLKINIKGGM